MEKNNTDILYYDGRIIFVETKLKISFIRKAFLLWG